jgi:SAM-dependent methyltransferase
MAAYDDFAWFYQRYWNEEFHSAALPILERIWLDHVAEGGHILDVCCGTGYLAARFLERGYSVTGIDASSEMIRYARETAPAAEFHVCDAETFRLPPVFDAAVSTFDSLNHVLTREGLERVFRNVAAALKPGAPFAFDMLLEEAYQTHWGEHFALVRDDHVLTITGAGYDFRSRLAQCTATMFRHIDGVWRRSDTVVRERCYSPGEIGAALETAGFDGLSCYDAEDLGISGRMGEGRTFFTAVRR